MPHFKSDDQFVYVTDDYMEVYIPIMFFDQTKRYAVDFSTYIETLGLVYCGLFSSGSLSEIKLMKHPYRITLYVYESETRAVTLPAEGKVMCRVLKYTNGTRFMDSMIVQDGQSSLQYLDMAMAGKIPKAVPYDKAAEALQKNKSVNHVSFGVRNEVEELVLAISYRVAGKLEKKFAELYGKDMTVSPYAYVTANTRQVCQYSSTFSALTFEDMDSMVTTSLNRSRENKKEDRAPIESIIKM